jgi:TetR/AcrR family fatty acid metabolism transcriptional regulator
MTAARAQKKPSARREEREADRKKTILRAAVEVFSKKGYHGCRIADVAREAGVAYGLVYHYFHNKDELLQSVFESGWAGFVERVQAAMAQADTLEARLSGIVRVAFEAYRHDPRGVKVLILEVGRSPAGGAVNRGSAFVDILKVVSSIFVEAQEKGELPAGLDPVLCAALLFGVIEMGLTSFVLGLLDRKDERVIAQASAQVAQTFLHGVLAKPPATTETEPWMSAKFASKSKAARRD